MVKYQKAVSQGWEFKKKDHQADVISLSILALPENQS